MGARRKARELALQMLFQYDMSANPPEQVIDTFEELQKSKPSTREFATKIFRGTIDHMAVIDEMIQNQAENWRLTRMAVVDRNIIRLGAYELLYANDAPPKVSLNEAVELAKRFGDEESSKFVNGILDAIHKTRGKPSPATSTDAASPAP